MRELEQWFFRITHYADELLEAADRLPDWPEKVLTMQRNWIGRSEGARVTFPLEKAATAADGIEVFTTRIDTIYGATFLLLAPEHPLVQQWSQRAGRRRAFADNAASASRRRTAPARMTGEIEKEGFDTGRTAINPFTERAGADLGRELRARRVRHRRGDGRAGARSARLRVRAQVQPADHGRRAVRRTVRRRRPRR